MVIYEKGWGYVLRSEPQTVLQALTFIDIIHIPINKQVEKARKRHKNVETSLVCDSDVCSVWRICKTARAFSFYRCFHMNEKLFFFIMIVLQRNFSCREEKRVSQILFWDFQSSCVP